MKNLAGVFLPFLVIVALMVAFSYFKINPFRPIVTMTQNPSPSPSHALFPLLSPSPSPASSPTPS